MIEGPEAIRLFEASGIRLFVGVPDSLMKGFCTALASHDGLASHIVAANEGGAVATAAGHYLATGRPAVVYMQNSGLGNAINPLTSLTTRAVYAIPMVLLIGWRGQPGTSDEPQHEHQGSITMEQLSLLDIPVTVAGPGDDLAGIIANSSSVASAAEGPIAILVKKGTFTDPVRRHKSSPAFSRLDAITLAVSELPHSTVYVATTGYTGRELSSIRKERGEGWRSDFLMVGSMGHAPSIALGMAMSLPRQIVCCLDGDGALAMHMGSLAVIGAHTPKNLVHLVLNNGVHESVGGQPSAVKEIDLLGLAKSAGYSVSRTTASQEELAAALREVCDVSSGPSLIEARISAGTADGLPRPDDLRRRAIDMKNWLTDG